MSSQKHHVQRTENHRSEDHRTENGCPEAPCPAPAFGGVSAGAATPAARVTGAVRPEANASRPRHRPYTAPAAPALCAGCGATYYRRRWSLSGPPKRGDIRPDEPLGLKLCPACRRRDTDIPRGVVHVDGAWTHTHRDDVARLLEAEISRAGTASPAAQVVFRGDDGSGGLLFSTTTEHLAVRLGRVLDAAYDGELRYGFANDNTLAHVWWRRD